MAGRSLRLDPPADPKKRYNATAPFPYGLPYETWYKEKIPLLETFRLAAVSARQDTWFGKSLHAAECGVYMGHSLVACAQIAQELRLNVKLHGFDTFEGLPELSEVDLQLAPTDAPYKSTKFFVDTSLEAVAQRAREYKVHRKIRLYKGLFSDSLSKLPDRQYFFVNIDCDLYEGHLECLEYFYPRMLRGGVMFFDDYHSVHYPMARKAVDKFLRKRPEKLFHLRYDDDRPNHTKSYIVKF